MQNSHRKTWIKARYALFTAASCSLLFAACSDDDDDDVGGGAGRAGASSHAGSASTPGGAAGDAAGGVGNTSGQGAGNDSGAGASSDGGAISAGAGGTSGDAAGAAGAAGMAGAGGDAGGAGPEAFRPEERGFNQQAFDQLSLPAGFAINVYRTGLGNARMLGVHGEHVYVTQPAQGNVVRLMDVDGDGVAESQVVVAENLPMVHGIAFRGDDVFLANVHSVYRGTVAADGAFTGLSEIIDDLPDGGQHARRTLGVGPDQLLYISIGSDCDACAEPNPEHATLLRSSLTGQAAAARTIFAKGLRNTIGFGWHPVTGTLWGMDQGSDWRGDDLPPEELNAIAAGNDYGWPYCFGARVPDPIIQDPPGMTKAQYCAPTTAPVLLNQAHQSPIGLTFYEGSSFPERYQEGAFVAFHGSWNRKPATGYRVAFIPFVNGQPSAIEDFVSGFLIDGGKATFGRPAGIAVAPDGALLFTDDTNGIVYRVQIAEP
jgi:glucose/arabinose dehydrogenase